MLINEKKKIIAKNVPFQSNLDVTLKNVVIII